MTPRNVLASPAEDTIVAQLKFADVGDTRVHLVLSPCRSGSTVLLRAVAATGIPGFYQPMKSILKWQSVDEVWCADIPAGVVCIKETWGPYFTWQIEYDPIAVLVREGIPSSRIRVLFLVRQPEDCWKSWERMYAYKIREEVLVSHFERAYAWHAHMLNEAAAHGVGTKMTCYERLHEPGTLREICSFLSIGGDPHAFGALTGGRGPYVPPSPAWFNRPGELDEAFDSCAIRPPLRYGVPDERAREVALRCSPVYSGLPHRCGEAAVIEEAV